MLTMILRNMFTVYVTISHDRLANVGYLIENYFNCGVVCVLAPSS